MFGVPTNKALGSEIQRVNKYIRLLAKQIGVKPQDIAIDVLTKDFPMFSIDGQESKVPVENKVSPSFEIISIED